MSSLKKKVLLPIEVEIQHPATTALPSLQGQMVYLKEWKVANNNLDTVGTELITAAPTSG